MKRFLYVLAVFVFALFIISCSSKINIVENQDGSLNVKGQNFISETVLSELEKVLGEGSVSKEDLDFEFSIGKESATSYNIVRAEDKDYKNIALKFYDSLDENEKASVDLLCAPVFTGEKMSVSEYEEVLASLYGKALASEIVNGKIEISVKDKGGRTKKSVLSAGNFLCGN